MCPKRRMHTLGHAVLIDLRVMHISLFIDRLMSLSDTQIRIHIQNQRLRRGLFISPDRGLGCQASGTMVPNTIAACCET